MVCPCSCAKRAPWWSSCGITWRGCSSSLPLPTHPPACTFRYAQPLTFHMQERMLEMNPGLGWRGERSEVLRWGGVCVVCSRRRVRSWRPSRRTRSPRRSSGSSTTDRSSCRWPMTWRTCAGSGAPPCRCHTHLHSDIDAWLDTLTSAHVHMRQRLAHIYMYNICKYIMYANTMSQASLTRPGSGVDRCSALLCVCVWCRAWCRMRTAVWAGKG